MQEELKFDEKGLIPAIVQNYMTGKVLMLGYMNEESYKKTLETNKVWFYSRSRQKLWMKGESSGNVLDVVTVDKDCDSDALLIKARPQGPTCHTGNESCFYQQVKKNDEIGYFDNAILFELYDVIKGRKDHPKEDSYTCYLFREGIDKILKKVGEESAETIIAAKNDSADEIIYETSDLIYHLLVMLNDRGVRLEEILLSLQNRRRK